MQGAHIDGGRPALLLGAAGGARGSRVFHAASSLVTPPILAHYTNERSGQASRQRRQRPRQSRELATVTLVTCP